MIIYKLSRMRAFMSIMLLASCFISIGICHNIKNDQAAYSDSMELSENDSEKMLALE